MKGVSDKVRSPDEKSRSIALWFRYTTMNGRRIRRRHLLHWYTTTTFTWHWINNDIHAWKTHAWYSITGGYYISSICNSLLTLCKICKTKSETKTRRDKYLQKLSLGINTKYHKGTKVNNITVENFACYISYKDIANENKKYRPLTHADIVTRGTQLNFF